MQISTLDTLPDVATTHAGIGTKKVILSDGIVPHLQQLGRVQCNPGQILQRHHHTDMYEIMIVDEGHGEITINEKTFVLNKGTCITVDPNEDHEIKNRGTTPLALFFFGIYLK